MSDRSADIEPPVVLEIERKYLLRGTPPMLFGREGQRLRQGYLAADARADEPPGRIRGATMADGLETFTHTIKSGSGLARTERERVIDASEFDDLWARTVGRRVRKRRHQIAAAVAGLVWQIDVFEDRPLVLAEIELPSIDTTVPIPAWLAPLLVRDVTDEPAFTNAALATAI